MDLNSRIESNRKGDFAVRLTGLPRGTKVSYRLERLEFQIGR